VARELFDWMISRGWRPTFGKGKQDGSWVPVYSANGRTAYPIALYTAGRIEIQFQHLKPYPPFDNEGTRLELLRRVNEISGVTFGSEVISRRPSIPLSLMASAPDAVEKLKGVPAWIEQQVAQAT
jgi:hypothetical protein